MKKISYRDRLSASFRTNEFKCRCRRADCDARPMDAAFIAKLQALRDEWGRPLIITSGARCSHWNTKVGGAVGSMIGQGIDQRLFGPGPRQGPRLGDLSVQSSTYGTQVPRIYGSMRVAGTVIWATDLKESSELLSGAKGQPGAQVSS